MTEKLSTTKCVYKIPDELWERGFDQFQIDLATGERGVQEKFRNYS